MVEMLAGGGRGGGDAGGGRSVATTAVSIFLDFNSRWVEFRFYPPALGAIDSHTGQEKSRTNVVNSEFSVRDMRSDSEICSIGEICSI